MIPSSGWERRLVGFGVASSDLAGVRVDAAVAANEALEAALVGDLAHPGEDDQQAVFERPRTVTTPTFIEAAPGRPICLSVLE